MLAERCSISVEDQILSLDPGSSSNDLDCCMGHQTLEERGISNNQELYLSWSADAEPTRNPLSSVGASNLAPLSPRRSLSPARDGSSSGSLTGVSSSSVSSGRWWLPDSVQHIDSTKMAELKEQSLIRLRPEEIPFKERPISFVAIDRQAIRAFHDYVCNFDYEIPRIGYLYGNYNELNGCDVHFIYEPRQEVGGPLGVQECDTCGKEMELVDTVAEYLNMRLVGWVFTQSSMCKDEDILNATEVFEAGLKQRKGGDRFVTVVGRVLMDEERHRKAMSFEAFQMSQQLVSVLDQVEPSCDGNLMSLKNPMKRFEYNTEWRNTEVISSDEYHTTADPTIFLVPMMVVWGKGKLRTNFPIENRTDRPQKLSSLQRLLDATKTRSLLFRMADFHVLLFLANVMRVDMDEVRKLCEGVAVGVDEHVEDLEGVILELGRDHPITPAPTSDQFPRFH